MGSEFTDDRPSRSADLTTAHSGGAPEATPTGHAPSGSLRLDESSVGESGDTVGWRICISLGSGSPWRHYVDAWPQIVVSGDSPVHAVVELVERVLVEVDDLTEEDRQVLSTIRASAAASIARGISDAAETADVE